MDRRPSPALSSSPLPSLDAVRDTASAPVSTARQIGAWTAAAGAAAVAGGAWAAADAPACGASRMDELTAHAAAVEQGLRRGDVTQTVREIGLALGWVGHARGGAAVGPTPDVLRPGERGEVTAIQRELLTAGVPVPTSPSMPMRSEGGGHGVDPVRPAPPRRPRAGAVRRVEPSLPVGARSPIQGGSGRGVPTSREQAPGVHGAATPGADGPGD